ncbi:MAG: hypothetical protein ACXV5L_04020 [Thermoanaerobaculia bacterium]
MDAIAFLTLFLGLTMGPQSIRMSATDNVKRIELRLDGAAVANMTAPPWQTSIDLGDTLTPHRLTATAFDASGNELETVEQKINLPRPTTEARIVVDHDRSGTPRKAHIIWKSVATRTPRSLVADLDGTALQIADDLTIALPKLSPTPHILRVKVVTTSGDMAEATTVIGASAAAEAQSQLTAVPLELSDRVPKPDPAGLLRKGDQPVKVVAIDAVPAEVIFVRDPSPTETAMRVDLDARTRRRQRGGGDMNIAMMQGVADTSDVHLGPSDTIRFLWPMASEGTGDVKARLFPSSRSMGTMDHGIRWLISNVSAPDARELRYADAIAVAGLQAAGSRRARAVVLIIGADYHDASALTPAGARAYLDQVGVPLYVWHLRDEQTMPVASRAWGDGVDVSTPEKFRSAARELASHLAHQRIAWVEGDLLPQEVALGSSAQEVRLLTKTH